MRWPKLVQAFTQSTPVSVVIDADGIDEDGAPIEGARWSGACSYQDQTVEVFNREHAETQATASLYIDGDPFSELAYIAGGEVEVFGETRGIVYGEKARNPDGTVNYTRLGLK